MPREEHSPLNKSVIIAYDGDSKAFPILGITKDPRAGGYEVPAIGAKHPDHKRYPTHTFIKSLPIELSGDQRVQWVYQILPGHTTIDYLFDERYGIEYSVSTRLVANPVVGSNTQNEDGSVTLVSIKAIDQAVSTQTTVRLEAVPDSKIYWGLRRESSFPPVLDTMEIVGSDTKDVKPNFTYPPDDPLKAKYTRTFQFGPPGEPADPPYRAAQPYNEILEYVSGSSSTIETTHTSDATETSARGSCSATNRAESQVSVQASNSSSAHTSGSAGAHIGVQAGVHTNVANSAHANAQTSGHASAGSNVQESVHISGEASSHANNSAASGASSQTNEHRSASASVESSGQASSQAQAHASAEASSRGGAHASQAEDHSQYRTTDGYRESHTSNEGAPATTDPVTVALSDESASHHSTSDSAGTGLNNGQDASINQGTSRSESYSLNSGKSQGTGLGTGVSVDVGMNKSQGLGANTGASVGAGSGSSKDLTVSVGKSTEAAITQSTGSETGQNSDTSQSLGAGRELSGSVGQRSGTDQSSSLSSSIEKSQAHTHSQGTSTQTSNASGGLSLLRVNLPPCLRSEIVVSQGGLTFTIPATNPVDLPWGTFVPVASNSEHWLIGVWVTESVEVKLPPRP